MPGTPRFPGSVTTAAGLPHGLKNQSRGQQVLADGRRRLANRFGACLGAWAGMSTALVLALEVD